MICLQKHIARYNLALPYCEDKCVADVGSGLGWGSSLVANVSRSVCGVEIDTPSYESSVAEYAKQIADGKLQFFNQSWMAFNWGVGNEVGPLETIVAFEVFEHIACPLEEIVLHTYRQLRPRTVLSPGGVLVASLPVMQGSNVYHLAGDMTYEDCRNTFLSGVDWEWYRFYYQHVDSREDSSLNVSIYDDDNGEVGAGKDSGYVIFVGGRV